VKLADARVTIVGLGLMGGSLAAALKTERACRHIRGVARTENTIHQALARGWIDTGTLDLASGLQETSIVILATPVRAIIELVSRLGPLLPAGCLLMDLGSTKTAILEAMQRLPAGVRPLGGHPVCGKEVSGIEAADARLFRGAAFVLCPLPRTGQEALGLAQELVEAVGARPMVMDCERHDRLLAAVSHLPYLLSLGLMASAEEQAQADPLLWDLAASGFRDTSRLAASDVRMMLDILLTNREAVSVMLGGLRDKLGKLQRALDCQDEQTLRQMMEAAQRRRREMFR